MGDFQDVHGQKVVKDTQKFSGPIAELAELVKVVKMQAWYHITARKLSRITQIPHTFRLE